MPANSDFPPTLSDYVPRRGDRRGYGERRGRVAGKKKAAQIGMTLSLGALVVTGLMSGRGAKILHIWSGMALVGFSVWHHHLYGPDSHHHRA